MANDPATPLTFGKDPIDLTAIGPIERDAKDETGKPRDKDFTVFVEAETFYKAIAKALPDYAATRNFVQKDVKARHSFDFDHPVKLEVNNTDPESSQPYRGRIHAVRCCKNTAFSVTFRSLKPETSKRFSPSTDDVKRKEINKDHAYDISTAQWTTHLTETGESARIVAEPVPDGESFHRKCNIDHYKDLRDKKKFLTPVLHSEKIAFDQLFGDNSGNPAGLLLIAGETGCGKTTFLNGILREYWHQRVLEHTPEKDRRPHMVVIGDPIETLFYKALNYEGTDASTSAQCQIKLGHNRRFDFTERVLGIDTPSVKDALHDALRETPAVVVVSELREDGDFRAALEFAATGHLIISTSHNTSLVDTMGKLMRISETKTAGDRANLAHRLLGLVHLIPHKEQIAMKSSKEPSADLQINVPAIWRANAKGIRNFVSEGLSSFVAQNPFDSPNGDDAPVLGRAWFVHQLREREKAEPPSTSWPGTHWKQDTQNQTDPFDQFKNSLQALDLHSF